MGSRVYPFQGSNNPFNARKRYLTVCLIAVADLKMQNANTGGGRGKRGKEGRGGGARRKRGEGGRGEQEEEELGGKEKEEPVLEEEEKGEVEEGERRSI